MGECHIVAANEISIGKNCAISWDTQIMDTDFHNVLKGGIKLNIDEKVTIGNHVWVGSRVAIGKGVIIPDNVIVASNSFINKSVGCEGSIIGGIPAQCIKKDCDWTF